MNLSALTTAFSPGWSLFARWAPILILVGILGFGMWKFNDAMDDALEAELKAGESKMNEQIAIGNRDALKAEIDRITLELDDLKARNEELKARVADSRVVIKALSGQRDAALADIRNSDTGATCEEKFRWMFNQAEKLKERHGD